jgi:hypothetical protein
MLLGALDLPNAEQVLLYTVSVQAVRKFRQDAMNSSRKKTWVSHGTGMACQAKFE